MKSIVTVFLCMSSMIYSNSNPVLFERYPALVNSIPYVQCAQLPTPVQHAAKLGAALDHKQLFIKRDDLAGKDGLYGGNKVRKLEFLLADAIRQGATRVITMGGVGTNHGVATACYAQQLGLDCLLFLKPQPPSPVVKQNLLLGRHYGAKIKYFESAEARNTAIDTQVRDLLSTDYFIPTGGSSALGTLGYVNAAFELRQQIDAGLMPEPDVIYVPAGSCGTLAGLLLGFALADIKSTIIAVAIEPVEGSGDIMQITRDLFTESLQLLQRNADTVPSVNFPADQLIINRDFEGSEYGVWQESGLAAIDLMRSTEGIETEGTYSAKAVAALQANLANHVHADSDVILLWNTYSGFDYFELVKHIDYTCLPSSVHKYFV